MYALGRMVIMIFAGNRRGDALTQLCTIHEGPTILVVENSLYDIHINFRLLMRLI